LWFEANAEQTVRETTIPTNNLDAVPCACDPSYVGGIGRKTTVPSWPKNKYETLSEK
jgi:hypothetical protein